MPFWSSPGRGPSRGAPLTALKGLRFCPILAFCHGLPDIGFVPMIKEPILAPFAMLRVACILALLTRVNIELWRLRKRERDK
jgi:hypothetical protein